MKFIPICASLILMFCITQISANYMPEREIVIIIPSYNNIEWCERNLKSVYNQEYTNYHVIYYDDCSTDGTYTKVCELVHALDQDFRTDIHRNPKRNGALYGIYTAIQSVNDQAIVINLDGDDWFHTNQALKIINEAYADQNVWMTYGQYICYPSGNRGTCMPYPRKIIKSHSYRGYKPYSGILSHPRTCYAWLFKQVKKEDLLDAQDNFYTSAVDVAYMIPMMEMAHTHCKFIPTVLYVYNRASSINVNKINVNEQIKNANQIHYNKPKYTALSKKIDCMS